MPNESDKKKQDLDVKTKTHLKGNVEITLHTHKAQSFMNGSWRNNNLGLFQFGRKLFELWGAYKKDDPYAYWYFIKIDQMMEKIQQDMKSIEKYHEGKLANLRGVQAQLFYSTEPKTYLIEFYSLPYFHPAAFLIADLDYISRQSFTLKNLGVFLELDKLPEKAIMPKIRDLFSLPTCWKNTGVTWLDIAGANEKKEAAINAMGELPATILKAQSILNIKRFGYSPKV